MAFNRRGLACKLRPGCQRVEVKVQKLVVACPTCIRNMHPRQNAGCVYAHVRVRVHAKGRGKGGVGDGVGGG